MGCEKIQIVEQRRHSGVEAVALSELQGQALAEIAGKDPGGVEALEIAEGGLDPADMASQALSDGFQGAVEITGVVDHIDETGADDPVGRVDELDIELGQQVVAQAGLAGRGEIDTAAPGA